MTAAHEPEHGQGQDAGGEVISLPTRYAFTDAGNRDRFYDAHGDTVRYCAAWSKWLVWDGRRWQIDSTLQASELALQTVRAIADEIPQLPTADLREKLYNHMRRSEQAPRIKAITELARSHQAVRIRSDDLDRDPWKLNVRNGTLDLKTLTLAAHSRDDLITKVAPVDYDSAAAAPRWRRFLEEIFDGDQELIHFVQRAVGYSLTGDTSAQVFFLLHGTGENGKSKFLEALRSLMGPDDYAQQTPPDTFLQRRYQGIPNDVARLQGARFVTAVETGEGKRLDETMVKRMTGGDRITARFLRAEFFEFEPLFKVWLATNHLPKVAGTDHAIWRRIRLIPFTMTFGPDKRDDQLGDKLHAELAGILNWALEGLRDYLYGDGLEPPTAVTAATTEYRQEEDVIGRFIAERCIVEQTARVAGGELYREYVQWCQSSGERYDTNQSFGRKLGERGYDVLPSNGIRWRIGIELAQAQTTLADTGGEPDWAQDAPGERA